MCVSTCIFISLTRIRQHFRQLNKLKEMELLLAFYSSGKLRYFSLSLLALILYKPVIISSS